MSNLFEKWFAKAEEHVSDCDLLAVLDGELSVTSTRRANRHLEHCWECRARYEQFEKTIVQMVGYRKHLAAPFLPPPSGGRERFLARLDQSIGEEKGSWGSGLLIRFSPTFVTKMSPLFASVVVVLFAVVMLFLIWDRQAPSVSANELLDKAEVWDRQPSPTAQSGVVFQKVRIHTKTTTTERTLYRDVSGHRKPKPAVARENDAKVNHLMEQARIDSQQPLSASTFREWYDGLTQKIDEVESSDPNSLTLITRTDSTDVKESSLSVRKTDFHPIARRVLLRDSEEIDISEINYDVLSWDAVNVASLFEDLPAVPAPPKPAPSQPATNPVETELAVRYALHAIGADLGESVDVRVDGQGPVNVVGIVPSAERKQQILAVLRDVPHVTAQLQTEEEVTTKESQTPVTRAEPRIVTTHSPIEKELLDYFGAPVAVENFSHSAIAVTEDLMANAWALRHLEERYSKQTSSGELSLSPSSQRMLETMFGDYRREMRLEVSELAMLARPFLESMDDGVHEPSSESIRLLPLFESTQEVQRLTLELLTGAEPPDQTGHRVPAEAVRELLAALHGLETTLENQP